MMTIKVQAVAAPRKPLSGCTDAPPPVMKNKTDLPGNFFSRLFASRPSLREKNGSTTSARRPPTPMAKGVYALQTSVMEADSLKTIDTQTTSTSSSADSTNKSPVKSGSSSNQQCLEAMWLPSTADDHNKGLPIVVRRPHHDVFNETDDRKLLHKIMGNAKKLPQSSGKYASNHIMVNAERTRKNVPPLRRDRNLDRVARDHAKVMADEKLVRHMDGPTELQSRILEGQDNSVDRQRLFFPRLGVNIARGRSIEDIHKFMIANLAERNNVLDKRFATMGMGTARDDNGMIYLCQVFGGE